MAARRQAERLEQDLLRQRAQTKLAVIDSEAPRDIITAASRRAAMLEDRGIGPGSLNATQETLLLKSQPRGRRTARPD